MTKTIHTARQFKWTRQRYKKASSLQRLFSRTGYYECQKLPGLIQRFIDLWDHHPQYNDPLLITLRQRKAWRDDDIPF